MHEEMLKLVVERCRDRFKQDDCVTFASYSIEQLEDAVLQLVKQRDEAREWVRKLTSEKQILTCVYCGKEYPPGTPTHGAEVLTEHIKVCEKHPMRLVTKQRDLLFNALAKMLGVESIEEFKAMRKIMPAIAPNSEESDLAIQVIDALLAVKEGIEL